MSGLQGKGKLKTVYPDFTQLPSGLQFKDFRDGAGDYPKPGDTVVIDWAGYTIGYYGRPFEARNKAQGGAFTGEQKDFYRFALGARAVIPAFEEAVASMRPGGIRRIVVPQGSVQPEIGYPNNDYRALGPSPTTFSGQRALDFVLANQGLIDKTLLFDIELVRVDRRG